MRAVRRALEQTAMQWGVVVTDTGSGTVASAGELGDFTARLARGRVVRPALSHWLRAGLSLNLDLSMVPAPLGLDPLAHSAGDGGAPPVANKTGADPGVRADAGIIGTGSRELAYAAICNYEPAAVNDAGVLRVMHVIGEAIAGR